MHVLVMNQAWKFLITFGDVLKLWPFTFDEFVQALHDYVSSLRFSPEYWCYLVFFNCLPYVCNWKHHVGLGQNDMKCL